MIPLLQHAFSLFLSYIFLLPSNIIIPSCHRETLTCSPLSSTPSPNDPAAIKLLVCHCTATKCNRPFTVLMLEACQMARFGQHGYHLLISRNGDIPPLLPETIRGCQARGYNSCSLGIAYEGGLDEKGRPANTRTAAQKASLYTLLKQLTQSYPHAHILGHCNLPHVAKACPCFPAMKAYESLQPENHCKIVPLN